LVDGSFRLAVLSMAIAGAFPVGAQELDEERLAAIAKLTDPASAIYIGAGWLSDPSRRFGLYSGVREQGFHPSLGFDLLQADKRTGRSLRISGRDLGTDMQEAGIGWDRQGAWRLGLEYGRTVRSEPMVVNTGLTGIGSETVTVNGTTIRPVDYSIRRDLFVGRGEFSIDRNTTLRMRFSHETKSGERLYGRGTTAATLPYAIELLAEPLDRTTETLEVAVSHNRREFQVSAGYYGTLFVNHDNALFVNGGATPFTAPTVACAPAPCSLSLPPFAYMSQPLDNNSHQVFVTGGYNLSPLTRTSFKLSKTIALQNESFVPGVTVNGNGSPVTAIPGRPGSLNGRVDTTLVYADVTSFTIDRVDLQANVRYEDRDDKTPVSRYLSAEAPSGTIAGVTGFNKPRSWSSLKSKVEAGYTMPEEFKAVAGWELDKQKREAPEPYRKVNFRNETDEGTARLELKSGFQAALNGSVSYSEARRRGSSYLLDTYTNTNGTSPTTSVNPLLWADRNRNAWKGALDWTMAENASMRVSHEKSNDHYFGMALGPRGGHREYTYADLSYAISERWNAHLWWSLDDLVAEQATQTGAGAAQRWQAQLRTRSEGFGGGVQGKFRNGVELALDIMYSDQAAEQRIRALTTFATNSLPDFYYRTAEVRATVGVPFDSHSGINAEYSFLDWRTNDWTWNGWIYSDGATLTQDYQQRTHFIGMSYYYRWH
jgi:MtrB/PioB family decaheme-associated outer membrane protein